MAEQLPCVEYNEFSGQCMVMVMVMPTIRKWISAQIGAYTFKLGVAVVVVIFVGVFFILFSACIRARVCALLCCAQFSFNMNDNNPLCCNPLVAWHKFKLMELVPMSKCLHAEWEAIKNVFLQKGVSRKLTQSNLWIDDNDEDDDNNDDGTHTHAHAQHPLAHSKMIKKNASIKILFENWRTQLAEITTQKCVIEWKSEFHCLI